MTEQTLVPVEAIVATILTLRGQRVILDSDLARLYGVETRRLNEQVKRNARRFPVDFMFQLTPEEYNEILRSQIAILKTGRGQHRKYMPYAFTEHGALMAANVLNSEQAEEVSVFVIRAFIQQRAMLAGNAELALKLERIERRLITSVNLLREHDDTLTTHESQIEALIEAINEIRTPSAPPRQPIGFRVDNDK